MRKVIVGYEQNTGNFYDDNGIILGTYMAANVTDVENKGSIDDLRKLKESGFTVEEIIQLKREGLV